MATIKLDQAFYDAHKAFEAARHKLDGIDFKLPDRESKSTAMDEFEKLVKDFNSLISSYRLLLSKDSTDLYNMAIKLESVDKEIAKEYRSELKKSIGCKSGLR